MMLKEMMTKGMGMAKMMMMVNMMVPKVMFNVMGNKVMCKLRV